MHLQGDIDAVPRGVLCQAEGVEARAVDAADLEQQRRQAGQVGVDDRGQRVGRVAVRSHGVAAAGAHEAGMQKGLGTVRRALRLPRRRQIEPASQRDRACRKRRARRAQSQQRPDREPAAARVADEDDAAAGHAGREQPPVGLRAVVHRRWMPVLGRQPVVHEQHPGAAAPSQHLGVEEVAIAARGDVRAAMAQQQGHGRVRRLGNGHLRTGHAGQLDAFYPSGGGDGVPVDRLELLSRHLERIVRGEHRLVQGLDQGLVLRAGHAPSLVGAGDHTGPPRRNFGASQDEAWGRIAGSPSSPQTAQSADRTAR